MSVECGYSPVGAQYHPFSIVGWKAGRSHPGWGTLEFYIPNKNIYTFEVTLPATSPDVMKILLVNQVLHPPGLGWALNRDGVHAELPAVVPGSLLNNVSSMSSRGV